MMEWIATILAKMPGVGKPQRKFFVTLFTPLLVARGKVNFRNLSRDSELSEKTSSRQFAKSFDCVAFHRTVIDEAFGPTSERLVGLDPSFLKQAGKRTAGWGSFYNGCAHRAEKGLELSSVAIVDLGVHTALTLSTRQSQPVAHQQGDLDGETLMDEYLDPLKAGHPPLHDEENILVVDGPFARAKVFDAVDGLTMQLISQLRRNARMRYYSDGPKRPAGSGRQRVYDGYVNWPALARFEAVGPSRGALLSTKGLHQVTVKRSLRGVVVVDPEKKAPEHYVLLGWTDPPLDARTIVRSYHGRAQIEFLFRDAKQDPGLPDCQARDPSRLDFHFNARLTTLNLAKAEPLKAHTSPAPFVFSMASVKARYFNEQYLHMIFSIFEVDPEMIKKSCAYQNLRNYGAIAA